MFGGVGPPGSRCDGFLTNLSHKDRSDVRDEEESKVEEEPEGKNVFLQSVDGIVPSLCRWSGDLRLS